MNYPFLVICGLIGLLNAAYGVWTIRNSVRLRRDIRRDLEQVLAGRHDA